MKVLVCARGYNTYSENKFGSFELDQAKALKDAGCDVRIASLDLRSVRKRRPHGAKLFASDGMHCVTVNSFCSMFPAKLQNTLSTKAAKKALKWICKDGWQPDVIHAHFTEIANAFALAADENAKIVVTEHSSLMNTDKPDAKTLAQAQTAYKRADKVIAVSKALADNIKSSVGAQAEVIGNIVDAKVFDKLTTGSDNGHFKFVSCGNLVDVKCFDVLIKAFSKLDDKNAELTVFGDGIKKTELEALCETLGVKERVHFKGHQPRECIAQEYAHSDAFVLASRSETFGVSFVEAMCAGLPVVATKCGGPESFVNKQNGLLVPVNDVDSLAAAMNEIQRSRQSFDSAGIKENVCRAYSAQTIAEKLKDIYKSLVRHNDD